MRELPTIGFKLQQYGYSWLLIQNIHPQFHEIMMNYNILNEEKNVVFITPKRFPNFKKYIGKTVKPYYRWL